MDEELELAQQKKSEIEQALAISGIGGAPKSVEPKPAEKPATSADVLSDQKILENLDKEDFYGIKRDDSASGEIDKLKSVENQKQTDQEMS